METKQEKGVLLYKKLIFFCICCGFLVAACEKNAPRTSPERIVDTADTRSVRGREDSSRVASSAKRKREDKEEEVIRLTDPSFNLGGIQFRKARYIPSDTLERLADSSYISPDAMHVHNGDVGLVLDHRVKYVDLSSLVVERTVPFPDTVVFVEARRGESVILAGFFDRKGSLKREDERCGFVQGEEIHIQSDPCLEEWASSHFGRDFPSYYHEFRFLRVPLFAHAGDTLVVYEEGEHVLEVSGPGVSATIGISKDRDMDSFGVDNDPILGVIGDTVFLISDDMMLETRHTQTGAADTLQVNEKMRKYGYGAVKRAGVAEEFDAYFDGNHIFLFYQSNQGLYIFRSVTDGPDG